MKTDISEFLMLVVYGALCRNATSPDDILSLSAEKPSKKLAFLSTLQNSTNYY